MYPNQTLLLNKSRLVLIMCCYDYSSIKTLLRWCFKNYSKTLLSFSSKFLWDGTEKVMEHHSCHTVTLTNDVILNPIENDNVHSPKKTRSLQFLKVSTFNSKIPVIAPIFTGNKLYRDDPKYIHTIHYPLSLSTSIKIEV